MSQPLQLSAARCTPCPNRRTIKCSVLACAPNHKSILREGPSNRQRRPQRLRGQAFFDRIFAREERHAPELVKLDAADEGGLGQTSAELFGPLAVLMVGFHEHEVQAFRSVMLDMEADMVKIIVCDKRMYQQTLRQALEAPGHMHTQRVGQRAMILSGMNAAEVGEIIGAYRDAGLPEPVWAAALAANWDRKIKDLVSDIYGDHNYMMERERSAGATR
ncbi:hypothetical protein ABBQ38_014360 [Trebouxia sp. C0009 RCD-2024]